MAELDEQRLARERAPQGGEVVTKSGAEPRQLVLVDLELDAGADFAVADGISGFTVESVPPVFRITLDLQCSTASRQLVFYWDMP